MYLKKLVGEKVYLSPMNIDDVDKYTKWLNDMEVVIGTTMAYKTISYETEKGILEKLQKQDFNFAIIDNNKNKNTLIGNIGFPHVDHVNKRGEVGIFIGDKEYWNDGYGTEALSLLIDFGFNILNLNSLYLRVYSYNTPAIKCYKKVGFKEAGRLREGKIIAGQKYDEIYMDILAFEFKSPYIASVLEGKLSKE